MYDVKNIENVYSPYEIEVAKSLITEIRFECLVKMYDVMFSNSKLKLPPQYFKNSQHLSLDFIKYSSEIEIGHAIKQMFFDLENHINKYCNQM